MRTTPPTTRGFLFYHLIQWGRDIYCCMKIIITESQYKFLVEQTTDTWLYDWFKNAPEEKIRNTFKSLGLEPLPKFTNEKSSISKYTFRPNYLTKPELLKIVEKRPQVVVLDKNIFDFINNDTTTGGLYINDEVVREIPNYLEMAQNYISEYSKLFNAKDYQEEINDAKLMIKRMNYMSKYAGKILLPKDIKERVKGWGISPDDLTRHEQMHGVYDATGEVSSTLIDRICKSSQCDNDERFDSVNKTTEVYAYLMTLRSKFKMSPIDVVKSVKVNKGPQNTQIVIVVDRNGKEVILKDFLPSSAAVLGAMECCTGDISQAIRLLHNSLARVDSTKKNSEMV